MKIKTSRFGTITFSEEKIISMPFGMLGFPDKTRFVILQHKKDSPFYWYQSVDDPALAFVITNPFIFKQDYKVDTDAVVQEMSWNEDGNENDMALYVVVNIPKGAPIKMTANLIGPILINNRNNQAVQMVIPNSLYSHQFPLVKEKQT